MKIQANKKTTSNLFIIILSKCMTILVLGIYLSILKSYLKLYFRKPGSTCKILTLVGLHSL